MKKNSKKIEQLIRVHLVIDHHNNKEIHSRINMIQQGSIK